MPVPLKPLLVTALGENNQIALYDSGIKIRSHLMEYIYLNAHLLMAEPAPYFVRFEFRFRMIRSKLGLRSVRQVTMLNYHHLIHDFS